MSTKKILEELRNYYLSTRGVGHTTTVVSGANNTDSLILFPTRASVRAAEFAHPGIKGVSITDLTEGLKGCNKPLVLDNSAVTDLLNAALTEINRLENRPIKG